MHVTSHDGAEYFSTVQSLLHLQATVSSPSRLRVPIGIFGISGAFHLRNDAQAQTPALLPSATPTREDPIFTYERFSFTRLLASAVTALPSARRAPPLDLLTSPVDIISKVWQLPKRSLQIHPEAAIPQPAISLVKTCHRIRDDLGDPVNLFFESTEFSFTTLDVAKRYLSSVPTKYRELVRGVKFKVSRRYLRVKDHYGMNNGCRHIGWHIDPNIRPGTFLIEFPRIDYLIFDFSAMPRAEKPPFHWRLGLMHAVESRQREVDLKMRVRHMDRRLRLWDIPSPFRLGEDVANYVPIKENWAEVMAI
ncbi:uncharacterized protein LTR77_010759 [Saxophila tyrrhenica]|uniref:Uncharacterized protein n=1 Tax=Saxophila tyrrhenica TaxID=1690608 RepID=A0AAV9NUT0_9PEZI|nr:hypothetical protein LTR77_010759 [Saxophila tyrrhenica]